MENKGFVREDSRGGCCVPDSESGSSGSGGGGSNIDSGSGGSGESNIGIVEMSEVTKASVMATEASPSPAFAPVPAIPQLAINGNGAVTCSDHCHSLHLQHQKYYREKTDPPTPESPWHPLKTIFLVGFITFLVIWAVVYSLLSHFDVL